MVKEFRLLRLRQQTYFYGELMVRDPATAIGAEYINMFWLRQWGVEWGRAFVTFSVNSTKSKKKKGKDFDLGATARGLVGNVGRSGERLTKKKKKLLTGKVGFEPGFTRLYLAAQLKKAVV